MRVEIEISEEELRTSVERKVRSAIADQANTHMAESYIKDQVRAIWKSSVDALVAEALSNSGVLREKIAAEIEKKLRAQLAVALKNAS